jgi:hypothetical protein
MRVQRPFDRASRPGETDDVVRSRKIVVVSLARARVGSRPLA